MSLFAISPQRDSRAVDAVAAAVEAAEEAAQAAYDPDAWAQDMAALNLAQELAARLGAPLEEVWNTLCYVPGNLLGLLESPEGWGVLSSHICATLGHEPARFVPAVH